MKKKRLIGLIWLIVLLSLTGSASARSLPLSDSAKAYVITCGPGNDFYTTFGHSALRITDSARGIDYVYNYGTFDFDTPHFYWKFAKGKLDYCLSRTDFESFMAVYDWERRWVSEQRLNFTPQEVNNLFVILEWNYLPENRYYRYDLVKDNCATRVRDMVMIAPSHREVQIDWMHDGDYSYRYFLHSCMDNSLEWWRLGVDLLLGLPTDKKCSTVENMFLPVEMEKRFAGAAGTSLLVKDNQEEELVDDPVALLQDTREPLHRSFPPVVVFALLLALVSILSWKNIWPRWADTILFIVAGLVGCFLIFMWFGTDHWCTKWNLNILWASPLLILIAIRHKKSPLWGLWLQEACFLVAAAWIVVCGLAPALLPIILTLALRVACLIPRKPQQPQRQR